jgi:hypothetical protein
VAKTRTRVPVDDEHGRITSQPSAYKPCPVEEGDKIADEKAPTSPGAVSMIKAAQKIVPKADPSALSTLAPSGKGGSSGRSMEGQLTELAGKRTAAAQAFGPGQSSDPAVHASLEDESNWHSDQPPAAWPKFPPGHPLARPTEKRTVAEALALAEHVEDRWKQSKSPGKTAQRPFGRGQRSMPRAAHDRSQGQGLSKGLGRLRAAAQNRPGDVELAQVAA